MHALHFDFYSFSDFLHDHCEHHQESEICWTIAAQDFLGSVALSHAASETVCHHTPATIVRLFVHFSHFSFFLVSGAWEISLIFRLSGSLILPVFSFQLTSTVPDSAVERAMFGRDEKQNV